MDHAGTIHAGYVQVLEIMIYMHIQVSKYVFSFLGEVLRFFVVDSVVYIVKRSFVFPPAKTNIHIALHPRQHLVWPSGFSSTCLLSHEQHLVHDDVKYLPRPCFSFVCCV